MAIEGPGEGLMIIDLGRRDRMRTLDAIVTPELVEQGRADGFAQVVTTVGPIGVLVDCVAPGDYLTLAS